MKGLIIYKGKYGATRQYAEWIGEAMQFRVIESRNCTERDITGANPVILGSSVYIGKLQIAKWIRKNFTLIGNNNVFMFVVSGTPLKEREKLMSYIRSSIPVEIADQIHIYFLPGRLTYKKLSLMDKFMLRMGAWLSKDAKVRQQMLTDYDDVKQEHLKDLLGDIRLVSGIIEPGIKNAS